MSTANKITFGNTAATTYSGNPTNFGYASGDNIQSSPINYQPPSTTLYGGNTSNYQGYQERQNVAYTNQPVATGYTGGISSSTVQPGIISGSVYQPVRDVSRPAPVTKITFGGKQFTETYNSIPQTTYIPPTQTYETYRQPQEIAVTSQPIREEQRYEQRVEPRTEVKEDYTALPAPVAERKKKTKKGGCPSWLWILLGILLLLGLIAGLIFLFGGFRGGEAAPTTGKPTNATTTSTNTTTTVTEPTTTTTTTNATTTTDTTGTTFVTPTDTTYVTPVTPVVAGTDDSSIEPSFFSATPQTTTSTADYSSTYTYNTPTTGTNYDAIPASSSANPTTSPTSYDATYYASPSGDYVSPSDDFAPQPASVY